MSCPSPAGHGSPTGVPKLALHHHQQQDQSGGTATSEGNLGPREQPEGGSVGGGKRKARGCPPIPQRGPGAAPHLKQRRGGDTGQPPPGSRSRGAVLPKGKAKSESFAGGHSGAGKRCSGDRKLSRLAYERLKPAPAPNAKCCPWQDQAQSGTRKALPKSRARHLLSLCKLCRCVFRALFAAGLLGGIERSRYGQPGWRSNRSSGPPGVRGTRGGGALQYSRGVPSCFGALGRAGRWYSA